MTPLQLFLSARIEMINRSAGDVDYLVTRVISRPNATKYTLGQDMTPVCFVMFLVLKSPGVKEDDLLNCLKVLFCGCAAVPRHPLILSAGGRHGRPFSCLV